MRVVFMGTPDFAVPSLKALAAHHEVVAVYTQPDRPRGRGRELKPSEVKAAALDLGLRVEQPGSLRDAEAVAVLREFRPEVIVVAAFGMILPPEVLEIPAYGCINVHASLLPKYRGAAPVHRAVLNGDTETGVAIMQMEEGLDTGPYASIRTLATDELTVPELTAQLADLGAEALLETLAGMESQNVTWTPQVESEATYASKITSNDVAISPELAVGEALRRVRASTPRARSRICLGDKILEVLEASRAEQSVSAGAVLSEKRELIIGLADGAIRLIEVKPSGKAAMDGPCFARGARIDSDCTWDCDR